MNIKKNTKPLVSIITINYNQSDVTIDLLESLQNISYPSIEIIVVDNASPYDDPDKIKNAFPSIHLIKSNKNLGFAGGNNLGIKNAKGEFLFFINNDTIVPENIIEPLVNRLKGDSTIGMVSPKIKFHWNPDLIQYAGYTKMNSFTIRNNSIGYHQNDGPEFNHAGETESIHGAAMMVPYEVVKKIGLMPEIYFLYYEEQDWAEMAKRQGYKIFYEPESYILHKESLSTGKNSPFKTYFITRNRMIFTRRNYKGIYLFVSILFQLFVAAPKNILSYLFTFKWNHFLSYIRALGWNFVHYKSINRNDKL